MQSIGHEYIYNFNKAIVIRLIYLKHSYHIYMYMYTCISQSYSHLYINSFEGFGKFNMVWGT